MNEIKRCPFCGSEAIWQQDGKWKYLECENLQCCASTTYDLDESGAAERWNTRPREDELEAEIERLRKLARSLINNLPDVVLNWAGPEIGWSNVSSIVAARDKLSDAISRPDEATK